MISQIIFTTHADETLSFEDYLDIGIKNDAICKSFGFTGRLFVTEFEHLNIIEGPPELNESYYRAFVNDPRASSPLRHFSRGIETREFQDYSVWARHSGIKTQLPAPLNMLTADNLDMALPAALSLKLRLIIESYVRPNLKAVA